MKTFNTQATKQYFPNILFNNEITDIANDGCLNIIENGSLVELTDGDSILVKYHKEVYDKDTVYKRA